jgi:Peptidase family S51.
MLAWEEEMRKRGYKMVMTSTQSDEQAQHFYRRLGYKEKGSLSFDNAPFEQPQEMVMMKRASAGSCILSPTLCNPYQDLFDENIKGYSTEGLDFVNFQFIPHLNSDWFPKIIQENLQRASENLEKIDDGAIFVDNENIRVVSEGKWLEVKV